MALGGELPNVSSADRTRAQLAFDWFNSMALPNERKMLLAKPRDEGLAQVTIKEINNQVLLKQLWAVSFLAHSLTAKKSSPEAPTAAPPL